MITGQKALDHDLQRLQDRVPAATRSALARGLAVIQAGVVRSAPTGRTGSVQRAIGKRLEKSAVGIESGKVGPNVAKTVRRDGSKSTTAPHAHLVVLGTKPRFTRAGASRGTMPRNNFVIRGLRKSESAAVSIFKRQALWQH